LWKWSWVDTMTWNDLTEYGVDRTDEIGSNGFNGIWR
jgi:hypothetical protein